MSISNWDKISRYVKSFLNERSKEQPVLLALSGGPDSMLLFQILLSQSFPFEVAHIDHQWRKESTEEAAILREICLQQKIPFHLKQLEELQGNLEDAARKERMKFFQSLIKKQSLQAVITGHHADDRAETVLKRLLEGASLPAVSALPETSTMEAMSIWRPLIPFTKKQVVAALEERDISYFEDPTNKEGEYLRARCRTELIPYLNKTFGKEVSKPLCQIADEIFEMNQYIENMVGRYPGAENLDFSQGPVPHSYELKYLIKKYCKVHSLPISRTQLESLAKNLQEKAYDKTHILGGTRLKAHGGKVSFYK